jgi:hypothetical protein
LTGKRKEDARMRKFKKQWIQIKKKDPHGILANHPVFQILEIYALMNLFPWDLLISLATSFAKLDFHVVAFFAVTLLFVRFILSLTGQGGMTMHQLQSASGLKLRTPSSMMNLLLMPSFVWY